VELLPTSPAGVDPLPDQLTICSVSFRSTELLKLNIRITQNLNNGTDFRWLIVDNHHDFQESGFVDNQNVQIIEGDPATNQGKLKGSYHHAQALNKALNYVSTRYLLIIDPDFFIVHKDWIAEALQHVSKNNLSFWGAPWYPSLRWKRRYFPTVSCLLIDLKKISKNWLDFTPELDDYHQLNSFSTFSLLRILAGVIPNEIRQIKRSTRVEIAWVILRNRWIAAPLSKLFPNRFYPNNDISRDTGFQIQNAFGNHKDHLVETLKPSFENPFFAPTLSGGMKVFTKLYRWLVPEILSVYPKRADYTTRASFKDFGLCDVKGLGWEEYFWQDKPFGIHLKSGTRKFAEIGYARLQEILFQIISNQT
jgi:hypothetical protein